MFNRNALVHLVIWPNNSKASIDLVDPDGSVVGQTLITQPTRGSDLARMLPADFSLNFTGCVVVSLSGDIRVTTVGEFDTTVVTERSHPSFEERFARLERRERRREAREAEQAEENARLRALIKKEQEQDANRLVESDVDGAPAAPTVQSEAETGKGNASGNAAVSQGGSAGA